jgi:hypothetical protein
VLVFSFEVIRVQGLGCWDAEGASQCLGALAGADDVRDQHLAFALLSGERWAAVVCKGKSRVQARECGGGSYRPCVAVSQGVHLGTSVARLLKECGERNVVRNMTCGMRGCSATWCLGVSGGSLLHNVSWLLTCCVAQALIGTRGMRQRGPRALSTLSVLSSSRTTLTKFSRCAWTLPLCAPAGSLLWRHTHTHTPTQTHTHEGLLTVACRINQSYHYREQRTYSI